MIPTPIKACRCDLTHSSTVLIVKAMQVSIAAKESRIDSRQQGKPIDRGGRGEAGKEVVNTF